MISESRHSLRRLLLAKRHCFSKYFVHTKQLHLLSNPEHAWRELIWTNLKEKINETERHINHHVSSLNAPFDVSPGGRHRPRVRTGKGFKPNHRAHRRRLGLRDTDARGTAIGVHHQPGPVALFVGCSARTHAGKGSRSRQPHRWHPRSFLLRLDAHRDRRLCALLCRPVGTRTVEPAMAPRRSRAIKRNAWRD